MGYGITEIKLMSEQQSTNEKPAQADETTEPKPGFFTRIFTKIDTAMKTRADEASKQACCSSDKKGKGGKCC